MKFKHSSEVISLIESRRTNTIELRAFHAFMEHIGNPQLTLKCIHIGGTNGKGSTTNTVSQILQAGNYKVGMFTSPYLETHHDRIRINDDYIEDEFIVSSANNYYDVWMEYGLSMFEIDMFIGTMYFVENKVDYAIFEVGLGGEKDATNIIHPLVSAITNIGKDHMEYLGNTYKEIATTKAGIVKEGVALITSEHKEECLEVFNRICVEKNSPFIQTKDIYNVVLNPYLTFDYKSYKNITQCTYATYQAKNISLAIEIIEYLMSIKEVKVSVTTMYEGIKNALWKGRFEVISESPLIILDGAHNNEGIEALVETCSSFKDVHIIFSALKDKPYEQMIQQLSKISTDICVCEFDFYRAAKLEDFKYLNVNKVEKFEDAISMMTKKGGMTLICGSLYFISLVRQYLLNKQG